MTEKKLTNGYIRKYDELLRLDLLNNKMFKKHQFILIILAITREFIKNYCIQLKRKCGRS